MSNTMYKCADCDHEIPIKTPSECSYCGSHRIAVTNTVSTNAKSYAKGNVFTVQIKKKWNKIGFTIAVILIACDFVFGVLPNAGLSNIGFGILFQIAIITTGEFFPHREKQTISHAKSI